MALILGILALAVFYLSRRFSAYFSVSSKAFYWIFSLALFLCITGVFYIMRANSTGLFGHLVSNISSIGLGILIILLMVTMVADLMHFAIKLKPIYYGLAVVASTVLLTVYGLWNAGNTKVIPLEFTFGGLTNQTKIMQFSDVHLGHYWGRNTLQELVDLTKKADVDAVVITGDLFDGRARLGDETIEPLTHLDVPVYFVQGNHDGYTGAKEIKDILRRNGIIPLSNEVAHLGELQIVGLDYMLADNNSTDMMNAPLDSNTMQTVLPRLGIKTDKPSILLHHNPIGVEYANAAGIDLYLAGHTHAGQLFPITWINSKIFRYNKGLYDYNGTKIYVSQGSGSFGPPMRLGTSSEITLITLNPASN